MNAMDYIARLSRMGAEDGQDYLGEVMGRHGYNNTREIPCMVARIEYNRINAKRSAPQPKEPAYKCRVHLHYEFTDRRRRDPYNYSGKMILDGLVRSGIISDDSFGCIDLVLSATFGNAKKRTIITIDGGKNDCPP